MSDTNQKGDNSTKIPSKRRASGEPGPKRPVKAQKDPKEMAYKAIENLTYVGTEFEHQLNIDDHMWCWDALVTDLCPGGELFSYANTKDNKETRKYIYMFATTEAQFVTTAKHPTGLATMIPVIVVIVSKTGLGPCKLGIKGVQMEQEMIIEGKKLRYEFAKTPLVPIKATTGKSKLSVPTIYVLGSSERISSGKNNSIDRQKTFEFANPYFFIPKLVKAAIDQSVSNMCNFRIRYPSGSRKFYEGIYSTVEDTFPEFSHIVADEEMKLKVMTASEKEAYLAKLKELKKKEPRRKKITKLKEEGEEAEGEEEKPVKGTKKQTKGKPGKGGKRSAAKGKKEKKEEEGDNAEEAKKEEIEDKTEEGDAAACKKEDEGSEGEDEDKKDSTFSDIDPTITPVTQEEYDNFLEEVEKVAKDSYKEYVDTFERTKKELKEKLDSMTDATREALDNLLVIKYYPSHPNFDMNKHTSNFAGRYVGEASKVVVCEKNPADADEEDTDEESEL